MYFYHKLLVTAVLVTSGNSFSTPTPWLSASRSLAAKSVRYQPQQSVSLSAVPGAAASYQIAVSGAAAAATTSTASTASTTSKEGNEDETPLFENFLVGIKRDYAKRLPLYKSDITDGLNAQALAAVAFLFFACLAPAVGFGALFGTATGGAIGTMEMVSSTAVCGMIYALTSAQPLTIIGSTGPVLAFVATLVQLAKVWNVPFLPLYSWTGLWTSAILFASAIFSGSNLVKYLTRFTDEIFSVLISVIFVVEACSDVGRTFVNPASTLTKALLTLTCAVTTFTLATVLKSLRNTSYFTKSIRKNVSNFAPTIGVVATALLARWARLAHGFEIAGLPALSMPSTFATTSGRPWLVPILDLPVWARWASFLPALMATVLLFLDQNITVRLVNNPSYKMTKGRRPKNVLDGMHADMLIISLLTAFQSVLGIPWLVAATVRSISHVRALSQYDEDNTSATPTIKSSMEQRVTGTLIHALIGCCVLFTAPRSFLTHIPKPAMMGLFLYLGTSALPGNEMWERIKGLFKDSSVTKKERWSGVSKKVVNSFTVLQCACLAAMFYVKSSPIGVLFPVIIAMLAPLRFGLEKFGLISKEDMEVLDNEG